jgi:hypothetical protein
MARKRIILTKRKSLDKDKKKRGGFPEGGPRHSEGENLDREIYSSKSNI